ncbi:type II and III secretion system protein [Sulfurimonas sp. C5]|uniref:type II and III secretion system protein n=1 Tax=Sulfurimonas sp. C5 TaxID=3036947 RepID=UPI002457ED34|nr:type II and III secretion system protein [Sulfurimonas sp. C5]MDH4944309.1 type II and III secretion system protein [Sulfurimonas sp. C5]
MKKIITLIFLFISVYLNGNDLVVFDNEYNIVPLHKSIKKVVVGNREMINVSLLRGEGASRFLKIFGKRTGTTSILLVYRDGSMQNYHVYVNKNLGYIQKMLNFVEPSLKINKIGDGSTVMTGTFRDPHNKKRVYKLLKNAGVDLNTTMDLTETNRVNKMIRTKLYLVEINNQKAKDLGGVTGLGFLDRHTNVALNPLAGNGATFSGWLLDNFGQFSSSTGRSVTATLNFLEQKGIGKILDDTVLITTEEQNASFRVGGEVYIPTGMTQNTGTAPTIRVSEKEYGLTLTLKTKFMEKENFMYIDVDIQDSSFDTNMDHNVQLGAGISVPSFVSKTIKTNVVVKSGQIIALGGRLHSEEIDQKEKVPVLGDIPLLGRLFTHTVTSTKGNDLLFFLVPEIVDTNNERDDSRIYRDFTKESIKLHDTFLDMNNDKEVVKEPLAVRNDIVVQKTVVEDLNRSTEDEIGVDVIEEEKQEVVADDIIEVSQETEEKAQQPMYAVSIENIYIRDKPSTIDSARVTVWKYGHKFKSNNTQFIDGIEWLEITEDCLEECEKLEPSLWISRKYTNKI